MPSRTPSSNSNWTVQQRIFVLIALMLGIVALTICVLRLNGQDRGDSGDTLPPLVMSVS